MKTVLFSLLSFFFSSGVFAKIWLPSFFSDHMVLQQGKETTIWGWTTSYSPETITVTGSWDNKPQKTDSYQGRWKVVLSLPEAGFTPYTITIKGDEEIVLKDVLVGEVWLCSGQSNMEWTASQGLLNKEEEIKNANHPNIRFFQTLKSRSKHPQDHLSGNLSWSICSPETMPYFSSVGYFFAREIQEKMKVPVGVIGSYWGGTPIEIWIEGNAVAKSPEVSEDAKKIVENKWWDATPGSCYNAMIHPLITYNIAGFLWYQGESNRVNAESYYASFPLLINSWRKAWDKELPFYFVQIAPFDYKSEPENKLKAAIVRDAQLHTMLTVPNTGMVVTNDIGDPKDIHPKNKQEVGHRLALWALAKNYGVKNIEYTGPIYKSIEVKKSKILVLFEHAEGLNSKGGELKEFQIAGKDGKYYDAKATIRKNTVEVSSKEVKAPTSVRFGFSDTAEPNLYNKAGLPASAFQTDGVK